MRRRVIECRPGAHSRGAGRDANPPPQSPPEVSRWPERGPRVTTDTACSGPLQGLWRQPVSTPAATAGTHTGVLGSRSRELPGPPGRAPGFGAMSPGPWLWEGRVQAAFPDFRGHRRAGCSTPRAGTGTVTATCVGPVPGAGGALPGVAPLRSPRREGDAPRGPGRAHCVAVSLAQWGRTSRLRRRPALQPPARGGLPSRAVFCPLSHNPKATEGQRTRTACRRASAASEPACERTAP